MMTIESVGSFLPDEALAEGQNAFKNGTIDRVRLSEIEDRAVRDIIERQIGCGLPYVTSGELRRKHWANDFWFGLKGISCENISSGHLYQPFETSSDLLHFTGTIAFNPDHLFFHDFAYLKKNVGNRALCRQTLPSPANLLLEMYSLSGGHPESIYRHSEMPVADIAEAYRRTIMRFHELGCAAVQYDDTSLGLMCDDNYTKRLLQGGVDLLKLHDQIINVINASLENLPSDMETSIYLSGGDNIVPEWEFIKYPDNIMPKALASLNVDKFFLPFNTSDDYALEILSHIPAGKEVVLGLADAHSPFPDNMRKLSYTLEKASEIISPDHISVSTRTGFKLSSYPTRGLTYEDQWRKIEELKQAFGN